MKKLFLVAAAWMLSTALATAGEHPLLGCIHCKTAKVQQWMSGFGQAPGYDRHACGVMDGNSAFGPCGNVRVPGPWYTYWPYNGTNLSSQYATPNWTYLHHFQTPAPWAAAPRPVPQGPGVPYYWSAR